MTRNFGATRRRRSTEGRAPYFFQRFAAALAAISLRRFGVSFAARAEPPDAARKVSARLGIFSPVTRWRIERAEASDSSAISSGVFSRGGLLTTINLASLRAKRTTPLLQVRAQSDP